MTAKYTVGVDIGGTFTDIVCAGPAIVDQPDTTTLLPRGWRCRVAAGGILLLEPVSPR
jgi:N-methylhydantoinase A/oxoprolinase/acetone carboxylase beta subunit